MADTKWAQAVEKLCGENQTHDSKWAQFQQPEIPVRAKSATKPPLYALIIGIDNYAHHHKLHGAVNDAEAFEAYLTNDLLVPESNISTLHNEEATRLEIIAALQGLGINREIHYGDPIVIYYSGHGSEIEPPPERAENGVLIQCIIPQDAGTRLGEVCPIPDFTIGCLLDNLARAKGDNITVIFDCCHSASGSREEFEGARFIEKERLCPLSENMDCDIIDPVSSSRELDVRAGFAGQAMNSHVLVAACSHTEKAYEWGLGAEKRGYFTRALLELLRRVSIDNLTYKGLMHRFPTLDTPRPQNPVCEGGNIDRIIFNAKVPGADGSFILITPLKRSDVKSIGNDSKTQKYYLQAGLAHGITPGNVFSVHTDHVFSPSNPSLGTFTVDEVGPVQSLLRCPEGFVPFTVPEPAYGRQIGYGSEQVLDVHFSDKFLDVAKPDDAWKIAFSGKQGNILIRPTDEGEAQVSVGFNEKEGHATFRVANEAAIKHGIESLTSCVPAEASSVLRVLRAAARWNWHLRRTSARHPFRLKVAVELYKMQPTGRHDKQGLRMSVPVGQNLNEEGEADIVVKSGESYGIKIINNSSCDLYVYPLYFSFNGQAIVQHHTRVCGKGKTDPSLPKWSYTTVGYGSGGAEAIRYKLQDKQDLDIGIHKIFLTTHRTDFSSLAQKTPFGPMLRSMASDDRILDILQNQPLWDTISLTVIQRRYPAVAEVEVSTMVTKQTGHDKIVPLLTARSEHPLKVSAHCERVETIPWFTTNVLTEDLLSKASGMRLRTLSRERAGNERNSQVNTWFDICIIREDGAPKLNEKGEPLRWRSHTNPHGEGLAWVDGPVWDHEHEIWANVRAGEYFSITVNAQNQGWASIAEEGKLVIW